MLIARVCHESLRAALAANYARLDKLLAACPKEEKEPSGMEASYVRLESLI